MEMNAAPAQMGMDARTPIIGNPGNQSPAMAQAEGIIAPQGQIRVQQIRRKRDVCACNFNNWYLIKDQSGQDIYFMQENSTCIEKNCCSGDCKAWRMDLSLLGPQGWTGDPSQVGVPFLHIERPFTLTCCCINRPKVYVTEVPSGNPLGTLEDPFAWCNLTTTLTEPGASSPVLKVDGSCCQFGLCCPCPGNKVDFPVMDTNTNQHVAHLIKEWTMGDCCPLCSKEWSAFQVQFGGVQTPRYKFLMLATAVFIQLLWFDKRNDNSE